MLLRLAGLVSIVRDHSRLVQLCVEFEHLDDGINWQQLTMAGMLLEKFDRPSTLRSLWFQGYPVCEPHRGSLLPEDLVSSLSALSLDRAYTIIESDMKGWRNYYLGISANCPIVSFERSLGSMLLPCAEAGSMLEGLDLHIGGSRYWGWFPTCRTLYTLAFPRLQTLRVGGHVFALREQVDWISSLKRLRHLELDHCPIIVRAVSTGITHDRYCNWDLHDWLHNAGPQQTVLYDLRWEDVLDKWTEDLTEHEVFELRTEECKLEEGSCEAEARTVEYLRYRDPTDAHRSKDPSHDI
jgi:hypothetical protein